MVAEPCAMCLSRKTADADNHLGGCANVCSAQTQTHSALQLGKRQPFETKVFHTETFCFFSSAGFSFAVIFGEELW